MRLISSFMVVAFLLLTVIPSQAYAEAEAPQESTSLSINGGWQFRWTETEPWKDIAKLENPPGRHRQTSVWFQKKLPSAAFEEPTLFVAEIQQAYDVFLDGQLIFRFGDTSGQNKFAGHGLNLIPLGSDYANKNLVFHIYSNYSQIGIFGDVKINSRSNLILEVIKSDLIRCAFAITYILVGIFFMFLFLKDRKQYAYPCFSLFLLFMGIWIISRSDAKFLLADYPSFWLHTRIYAINLVPVVFVQFYEQLLGRGYRNLTRRIWQLHLAYALLTAISVQAGLVPIMNTLVPFDVLLLCSIIYTISFGLIKAFQGNYEAKIFSIGVITFALTSAYDILNNLGFLSWTKPISHWGLFIFVISMVFILGRQFLRYGIIGATLNFQKEQMEQTMRAMTTGTAMLNHAIKNEITKINFLAGRTKDGIAEQNYGQANESVDAIFCTVHHLKEMVDKIKERTAEIHLNEQVCDIEGIVEKTVSSLEPYLQKKNITLLHEIKDKGSMVCDPFYLGDAFMNIFLNAAEAVESVTGKLYLKTWRTRKDIVFEFKDNGCGIPEAFLQRVFEPFFSTKNRKDNHGLGLSYCYNIIRKHGGSLDIESKVQGGTTVTVRIPCKK